MYETRSRRVPLPPASILLLVLALGPTACATLPRQYELVDGSPSATKSASPVNINRATAAELAQLPGIGKVTAARIIVHRSKYGDFRRIEHLMMVRGISEKKFRQIRSLVVT